MLLIEGQFSLSHYGKNQKLQSMLTVSLNLGSNTVTWEVMSKIHLKVLLRVICIAIAFLVFYWLRGLRTLLARFLGGMINVDRTMCLGHRSWFKNM